MIENYEKKKCGLDLGDDLPLPEIEGVIIEVFQT